MPRRKVNLPLIEVIGISLVLHLLVLFVVGGYTVWQMVKPPEPEFEAPPPIQQSIEPQELKVKLQKTQKQSRQPTRVLQVQNVSQINLPQLDISMPTVDAKVAVAGSAFGGGGGLGRGFGSGGLDMSKSAVNFFGIESTGENIVFIVDVTRSMLEPSRGDVKGFNRVKQEIGRMIDDLNAGTLFNIYAYERGLDVYSSRPLPATPENKEAAKKWINQYWAFKGTEIVGKKGASSNNYKPTFTDEMKIRKNWIKTSGSGDSWDAELKPLPKEKWGQGGRASSRMDLALLAAFENYADAIFVITDGTPEVAREIEDKEFRDWVRNRSRWEKDHARMVKSSKWQDYIKQRKEYQQKVAEYKAERRKKGLPPEIKEHGYIGGIKPPNPPDGWPPNINDRNFSFGDLNDLLRNRAKDIYDERDRRPPPMHIVGYGVSKSAQNNLEELQKGFSNSKFRNLNGKDLEDSKQEEKKSDSLF